MTDRMRRIVVTIVFVQLILAVGAVARAQSVAQLLQFVDEPMRQGAPSTAFPEGYCGPSDLTLRGDTLDAAGVNNGRICVGQFADTVRYLYQEDGGDVWLIARKVYVDSASLVVLADSVETALDKRFGKATRCHRDLSSGSYTERLLVWPSSRQTWLLRTSMYVSRPALLPAIWFERVRGRRDCRGWVSLVFAK
jgi:hypothetical protein